jgi:hypothetical protein
MAGPLIPGRRRRPSPAEASPADASPARGIRLPRAPVDWPAVAATVVTLVVVLVTAVLFGYYLYRAFVLNAPQP